MLTLSARAIPEVRAAVLAFAQADRDIKKEINTRTRTQGNPLWQGLVEANASRARDARVLAKGARIKPGNPPRAVAASSRRPLPGGLVPAEQWSALEFGADRNKTRTYTRVSPKGKSHQVTRHTTRQLPPRYRKGRVVFPAFQEAVPRVVTLWLHTIVRTMLDRLEGKV